MTQAIEKNGWLPATASAIISFFFLSPFAGKENVCLHG